MQGALRVECGQSRCQPDSNLGQLWPWQWTGENSVIFLPFFLPFLDIWERVCPFSPSWQPPLSIMIPGVSSNAGLSASPSFPVLSTWIPSDPFKPALHFLQETPVNFWSGSPIDTKVNFESWVGEPLTSWLPTNSSVARYKFSRIRITLFWGLGLG